MKLGRSLAVDACATVFGRWVYGVRTWCCVFLLVPFLAGCSGGDMEDLRAYAEEVLTRKGGRIEPPPELKPYEGYTYQSAAAERKDPFRPFFQREPEAPTKTTGMDERMRQLLAFETNRNKEELETFPLDSLRMVGILEQEDTRWAIVLASEGTVHRVTIGNYLGRNFGKVTNVFEDRIEIREIVSDGAGSWQEREASLALVE